MKFPPIKSLVSLCSVLLLATGCASFTRGTMDKLVVESTPEQASVDVYRTDREFNRKEIKANLDREAARSTLSGEEKFSGPLKGETPASFKLARKGEYRLMISRDGYETAEFEVTHQVAGWGVAGTAGNAVIGGLIGVGVDAATGAMLDLTPNPVVAKLEPDAEPAGSVSDQGSGRSVATSE